MKGVILDVDGTLIESNDAHARAWEEALRESGLDVPFEKIRPLIGMGGDLLLPRLTGIREDSAEGERISEVRSRVFLERYLPKLRAFPKARELLLQMRDRGWKLVTGSSAKKSELEALLKVGGIDDLFDRELSSDDVDLSKPAPDVVEAALSKLRAAPDDAVLVGDTPYDIASGRKAGVRAIALRCGGWSDDALSGALAIYDDPADLSWNFDEFVALVEAHAQKIMRPGQNFRHPLRRIPV